MPSETLDEMMRFTAKHRTSRTAIGSSSGQDDRNLMLEMQLVLSEKKNIDLGMLVQKLQREIDDLKLKQDAATAEAEASDPEPEIVALQQAQEHLLAKLESKAEELETSRKETETFESQNRQLKSDHDAFREATEFIRSDNDNLKTKLDALRAEHAVSGSTITRLHAKLESMGEENENLKSKLDPSRADHTSSITTISRLNAKLEIMQEENDKWQSKWQDAIKEKQSLAAVSANLERNIQALDAEKIQLLNAKTRAELNGVRLTKALEQEKAKTTTAAASAAGNVASKQSELDNLRRQLTVMMTDRDHYKAGYKKTFHVDRQLESKVKDLKRYIAGLITDLDLVIPGDRVYTCKHHDLSALPDGQNATAEFSVYEHTNYVFCDKMDDADFYESYKKIRRNIVDHHRAHDRVNLGRGEWADTIIRHLVNSDRHRGVSVAY